MRARQGRDPPAPLKTTPTPLQDPVAGEQALLSLLLPQKPYSPAPPTPAEDQIRTICHYYGLHYTAFGKMKINCKIFWNSYQLKISRKKSARNFIAFITLFMLATLPLTAKANTYTVPYTSKDGEEKFHEIPFNPDPSNPQSFNDYFNTIKWKDGSERKFYNLRNCSIEKPTPSQFLFQCNADFDEFNPLGERTCIDATISFYEIPDHAYYSKRHVKFRDERECGPYSKSNKSEKIEAPKDNISDNTSGLNTDKTTPSETIQNKSDNLVSFKKEDLFVLCAAILLIFSGLIIALAKNKKNK